MATRGYLAATDPATTGTYRARIVLCDSYSRYMVPTLRAIWTHTCHADTPAMGGGAAAPRLVRAGRRHHRRHRRGPPHRSGRAGVGVALTGEVTEPTPLLLDRAGLGQLDAQWIYLIDAASDAFALFDTDMMAVIARYPFAD